MIVRNYRLMKRLGGYKLKSLVGNAIYWYNNMELCSNKARCPHYCEHINLEQSTIYIYLLDMFIHLFDMFTPQDKDKYILWLLRALNVCLFLFDQNLTLDRWTEQRINQYANHDIYKDIVHCYRPCRYIHHIRVVVTFRYISSWHNNLLPRAHGGHLV